MNLGEVSAQDRVSESLGRLPSADSGIRSDDNAVLSGDGCNGSSIELIRTPSLNLLDIHSFQAVFKPHSVRMVEIVQSSSFHFVNYTLARCLTQSRRSARVLINSSIRFVFRIENYSGLSINIQTGEGIAKLSHKRSGLEPPQP